jgi:hypothetical protein
LVECVRRYAQHNARQPDADRADSVGHGVRQRTIGASPRNTAHPGQDHQRDVHDDFHRVQASPPVRRCLDIPRRGSGATPTTHASNARHLRSADVEAVAVPGVIIGAGSVGMLVAEALTRDRSRMLPAPVPDSPGVNPPPATTTRYRCIGAGPPRRRGPWSGSRSYQHGTGRFSPTRSGSTRGARRPARRHDAAFAWGSKCSCCEPADLVGIRRASDARRLDRAGGHRIRVKLCSAAALGRLHALGDEAPRTACGRFGRRTSQHGPRP